VSLSEQTTDDLRRLCTLLEAENDQKQARICQLEEGVAELKRRVDWYEEQARLAARQRFAPSSEHTPVGQEAFVFNEAEAAADPNVPEPTAETVTVTRRKKAKGHRQAQLANLEVREIEYPLPEDKQICECCGEKLHFVNWQVTEKVEVQPAKATRVLHKQPIYACRDCQNEGEPAPIKTAATMPEQAFPKSIASPSLVAHIITEKFVMGAPLYRQEQYIESLGLFISRQTMANWMIQGAKLLTPACGRMHEIMISLDILHADETTVQVLKEAGRSATTDSTMWLYRSGRDGPPMVVFDYQTSRAGKHAKEFLRGFGGFDPVTNAITKMKYLHVDGHGGYNEVPHHILVGGVEMRDVILAGCWSHVRRKFVDALAVLKGKDRKSGKKPAAEIGLQYCNDLFNIERELKDVTPEEHLAARKERSAPIVGAFKEWLDKQAEGNVLPETTVGKAVAYCLNQWTKLTAFLEDGRLEIDNNRAERSIKPFVIGRKNWLFANTPKGAKASATIYSIVETAKENGLIPFEYLTYLFERLPNINTEDKAAIDNLLPWSTTIPDYCRKAPANTR
jgi:transposase